MSYYAQQRRRDNQIKAAIAVVAVIFAVFFIGGCVAYHQDSSVTLKVTGKESVNTDDGHEYRIYSDDEVYVMADSLFKGRFRTSNDYAKLQPGKTYTCTKFGWRIPIFSSFENIRDCHEVAR